MLIVGNWKMNGSSEDVVALGAVAKIAIACPDVQVVVCPPFTLLRDVLEQTSIRVGAQDCHEAPLGAHTGCISATMIKAAGADYVLVGHSERRHQFAETDQIVSAKTRSAVQAGLLPIVCVGETLSERMAGRARDKIARQIDGLKDSLDADIVIAYEPVWAIGTGKAPTAAEVGDMLGFIRTLLCPPRAGAETRLLYGGSVSPTSAPDLLKVCKLGGLLVGGTSLNPAAFGTLVELAHEAIKRSSSGSDSSWC